VRIGMAADHTITTRKSTHNAIFYRIYKRLISRDFSPQCGQTLAKHTYFSENHIFMRRFHVDYAAQQPEPLACSDVPAARPTPEHITPRTSPC
jgi:hypothetical protein